MRDVVPLENIANDDAEILFLFYFCTFCREDSDFKKKARDGGARLFLHVQSCIFVAFCCLLLLDMGLCLFIPFHLAFS